MADPETMNLDSLVDLSSTLAHGAPGLLLGTTISARFFISQISWTVFIINIFINYRSVGVGAWTF